MSVKLDPKEVLEYLNELGFNNITAQQLKEFMRDLKRLIKYDIEKADKENIPYSSEVSSVEKRFENSYDQTDLSNLRKRKVNVPSEKRYTFKESSDRLWGKAYESDPQGGVFSNLHSASTISSRAKSAHPCVPNVSFAPKRTVHSQFDGSAQHSICTNTESSEAFTSQTQSYLRVARSKSQETNKPKSFIRPVIPLRSSKSDPVSLYHQYQAEWKKQKLPGEDDHKELRWAIREKMLSGPIIRPGTTGTSSARTIRSTKRL